MAASSRLAVDWFFLLPYLGLKYLTPAWLVLIATVIVVYGLYIPYQLPETRAEMGIRDSGVAEVIDLHAMEVLFRVPDYAERFHRSATGASPTDPDEVDQRLSRNSKSRSSGRKRPVPEVV